MMDLRNKPMATMAVYRHPVVPAYRGNPLIEAIYAPPNDHEEAVARLLLEPEVTAEDLALPPRYRRAIPEQRLQGFFYPSKEAVKLLDDVHDLVVSGLVARNPMMSEGQALLYRDVGGVRFATKYDESSISLLTGPSGAGKTAMIKRVCQVLGAGLIQHQHYWGQPFFEKQLLVLYIKLPARCTAERLAKDLCLELERQTGESIYHSAITKSSITFGDLMENATRLLRSHHVGLIVFDDAQWLRNISVNRDEIYAMLVNFRSQLKIPVMLVGTYQLDDFIAEDASVISRAAEGGIVNLQLASGPEDEDWDAFSEELWSLNWASPEKPKYSPLVAASIFEYSQGIRRFAIKMAVDSQKVAITEGLPYATVDLLKKVYDAQSSKFKDFLEEIRRWRRLGPNALTSRRSGYEAMFPKVQKAIENEGPDAVGARILELAELLKTAANGPVEQPRAA